MPDNATLLAIMERGPVLPVVIVDDPAGAVGLARALLAGGVTTIEVTLRTDRALDCVRAIRSEVPDIIAGVGTVLEVSQLEAAAEVRAGFAVSPGITARLLDAAADAPVPQLPGAATASEVMTLLERGWRAMKFFPAEPAGGVGYLKSLASPLPLASFCPTGGITARTAPDYLALANVRCVGGSWLAPPDAVGAGDWARIAALARAAGGFTRG